MKQLTYLSRSLRRNQTEAEKALWHQLRDRRFRGLKFRRQFEIEGYIADFACLERGLIIEVDGGQHAESEKRDALRTEFLEGKSFMVLRFWNNEVLKNMEGVLLRIDQAANTLTPSLSLKGEGETSHV